jgi:hypothetical protein
MATERGGLDYKIQIEDAFSKSLELLIKGVRIAKKELEGVKGATKGVREAGAAVKKASEDVTKGRQKQEKATKSLTASERRWITAAKLAKKELDRMVIAARKARIEAAGGYRAARRRATAEQNLSKAHRQITKELNRQAQAQALLAAAQERGIGKNKEALRKLGLMSATQAKIYDTEKRLKALREQASNTHLRRLAAEEAGLKRIAAANAKVAQAEFLRSQGRADLIPGAGGRGSGEAVDKTTRRFDRLRQALHKTTGQANRVSFTFRRLFGILAAFTAARAIFRGFRNLVTELIRFNASIEQATLGVAALFTAVGDVRDATGAATTATEGLALAQRAARQQVALLRRDALKTAATFEQLLETFQVAVAPGLQSGLDINQVRKFTLDISRAASAIGLQQNQLAEEIRSILQGTIQARTTRIAVALGITNEDIRNAKEAGVLFDFLQKKFVAFDVAGEEALKTFNALFTNLKGGIQQVLEGGGVEFFQAIKDTLKDLFDLIINEDEITGIITPDPRAVEVVEAFSAALLDGLNIAREIAEAMRPEELVGAAESAGHAIRALAFILAGMIKGFIQGVRDLGKGAKVIGVIFEKIAGVTLFDKDSLLDTAALIGRILTVILGIGAAVGVIKLLGAALAVIVGTLYQTVRVIWLIIGPIPVLLATIKKGIYALKGASLAVLAPFTTISAVLAAIVVVLGLAIKATKEWQEEVHGVELSYRSTLKLLGAQFTASLDFAVAKGAQKVKSAQLVLRRLGVEGFAVLEKVGGGALEAIVDALSETNTSLADFDEKIKESRRLIQSYFDAYRAGDPARAKKVFEEFLFQTQTLADNLAEEERKILEENDPTETIAESLVKAFEDAFGSITNLFSDIPEIKIPGVEIAESFLDIYERMGVIINSNREGLDGNVELLKEMKDAAIEARDALALGTAALGLDSNAAKLREAFLESEFELRDRLIQFDEEEANVKAKLKDLQRDRLRNETAITNVAEENQGILKRSIAGYQQINRIQSEIAGIEDEVLVLQLAAERARAEGRTEDRDAAIEKIKVLKETIAIRAKAEQDVSNELIEQANLLGLSEDTRTRIFELAAQTLLLDGREITLAEAITRIEEDRLELTRRQNAELSDRLSLVAREAKFEADTARPGLRAELLKLQAEADAERSVNFAEGQLRIAQAEVELARAQRDALDAKVSKSFDDTNKLIAERVKVLDALRDSLAGLDEGPERKKRVDLITEQEEKLLDLKESQNSTFERNLDLLGLQQALVDDAVAKAEKAQRIFDAPVLSGFLEGLHEFAEESINIFDNLREIVKNSFEQLADTLGQSITDALTGRGTNFQQAFSDFLAGVANEIISMLIRIAIIKSILGLDKLFGGTGDISTAFGGIFGGAAKGGKVGRKGIEPPHASARGFAKGGGIPAHIPVSQSVVKTAVASVRPSGLDSKDRIPIWTAPGEYVVREKAVDLYGAKIMDLINAMAIDPSAMRAIAGVNTRGGHTSRVSGGAAAGGQINATSGAPTFAVGGGSGGSSGPQTAIVAGDEATMQQLLYGGRSSMLDFMREERAVLSANDRSRL